MKYFELLRMSLTTPLTTKSRIHVVWFLSSNFCLKENLRCISSIKRFRDATGDHH